ncbi:MAG: hypothetical protein V3V93_07320, partial [bacterium]
EASRLNIPVHTTPLDWPHKSTPESTFIKQLLEEALKQLPSSGCTIVVFGPIGGLSPASDQLLMEEVLYGTLMTGTRKCEVTNKPIHEEFRLPTGIFCGLPEYKNFNRLSAVLWIKLESLSDGRQMGRHYRLYVNGVANEPMPDATCDSIVETFRRWKNPPENNGDSMSI